MVDLREIARGGLQGQVAWAFRFGQFQMLPRLYWFPREFLDANDPRVHFWRSVGVGAGLGLAWGIVARIWMRLISAKPEFSMGGTAFILAVPTVFGACAGLAYLARRRGWARRAHYLCRGLVVLTFIPFGFGGGGPLMLTGLLTTVGLTQTGWPRIVRAIPLLLAVAGVVFVSWEIVKDNPGILGVLYVLFYLVLLHPLCIGLSTGLQRFRQSVPNGI